MISITGKNRIGSQFSAEGTKSFKAKNPSDERFLAGDFFYITEVELNRAMKLAESAFTVYRHKSNAQRADFLDKIADEIMAIGDDLVTRCVSETGLPAARIISERGRTVGQLRLFSTTIRKGDYVHARIDEGIPDRKPLPMPDLRRMLIPLGPVLVFGASNFPLAFSTAGGDTASALAAGCPVLVKAHSSHPGTNELISAAILKAAKECDMPDGVFSMFYAERVISIRAVENPVVKAIGFTGSRQGGMSVFKAAVNRDEPIPVYAEMSAINPVVILPGALREKSESIADGLVASITNGVGQFCTNPGIVFLLEDSSVEPFLDQLAQKISNITPGTMLNEGICKAYFEGIENLKNMQGVFPIAVSSKPADKTRTEGAPAIYKVSGELFLKQKKLSDEVFGPASLVVICKDATILKQALSGMEGQLTATLHAGDQEGKLATELLDIMTQKAGRVLYGGFPTGVEVSPAQQHGGPFPATSDSRVTSVGTAAIERFMRPVTFQNFPDSFLPDVLKRKNPISNV